MGKLVWAAIGFAAAALLAEYALPIPGLPYIAAALVLLSPAGLLLRGEKRRRAVTVCLAGAMGLLAWWGYYELRVAPGEALAGQDIAITAEVTEYPLETAAYSRVTLRVLDGAPRERGYVYLYEGELPELRPGDIIEAVVRYRPVMERGGRRAHVQTAAGRNMSGYFKGEIVVTGRGARAWRFFPQELARFVKERCEALFPGRTGIFMKALLTGDKEDLYADVPLYESMRQAGMLHAVAVSGMHIFVLIGFIQWIFGRGRRTSLLCIPVMVLFVLMTGCGPSVVRAAVMQTIFLAAPILGRESDSPSALSAALLGLLLVNPMSVGGIALQLSFACMAGYAVFLPGLLYRSHRRRHLRRSRLADYGLASLANTACATVFSIPVSALYFGTVALLSPLANFLTLPVVELCFAGGYVLCVMSALLPGAAAAAAVLIRWAVGCCTWIYGLIARLPLACLYTTDPKAVLWLAFVYLLLGTWLVLRRRGVRIRPVLPAELALIALGALFLTGSLTLRLGRRELTVLDVGQGESVVCFDRDGAVVLDCGGSDLTNAGDAAADLLHAAGVGRVDALILSHLHEDHVNGVETLLYRLPVDRIILPGDPADEDDTLAGILAAADRAGTEVLFLSEPADLDVGGFALSLRLPAGEDENDRGIVTFVEAGGKTVLMMGDAGREAELDLLARGFLRDVDTLIVGHHGSRTATSAIFLGAVRPETAVISVGYNSYGHPAEEVLERLEGRCEAILRTDTDGNVTVDMRD